MPEESKVSIIDVVKTPLGFFTLVVLIVEALLIPAVGATSGLDRTMIIAGMMLLMVLLVIIVAFMAIKYPLSLYLPKKSEAQVIRVKLDFPEELPIQIKEDVIVNVRPYDGGKWKVMKVPVFLDNFAWFLTLPDDLKGMLINLLITDVDKKEWEVDSFQLSNERTVTPKPKKNMAGGGP